ncbi:hypothetical protein ACFYQ5_35890 [Streptomyces sp. NPDC005794]|uniref:hypothetical protein n=1 Tax=Streptomyces sp. NPDC005794 TaxID=3364733 RepID=UPI00368F8069
MRISASVRSRSARTGVTLAAAVAVAGATLAGAPAAFALGESGDIDIQSTEHSRGGHHEEGVIKVCEFKLVATNFDGAPSIGWSITEQPPASLPLTSNTLADTLPLAQGRAESDEYRLPNGTYLLQWPVPGATPKQKNFTVDCSHEGKKEEGHGGSKDSSSRAGGEKEEHGGKTGGEGSSWSGGEKEEHGGKTGGEGSSWSGGEKSYDKPSGAVPAGGGGVPDMESVSSESESNVGASTALVAGAVGIAGLIVVRRSARRRARNEA